MTDYLDLLAELSDLIGISGMEDEVRDLIARHIRDYVDDLHIDPMGNLLAIRRGTGAVDQRVLAAAHMDEVGMMVSGFDSDGSLGFRKIGSLDDRILPGTRVLVGRNRLPGVIQWVPIHLDANTATRAADRLRIDIGASSKSAAQKHVKLGDVVAFDSQMVRLGPTVRGKAFDDRAGCVSLIKLIQGERFPFDLAVAFTVQEEVGLRGARVAAQRLQPDAAYVLETTACHDLPPADDSDPDTTTITVLGDGPAITARDRTTISDPRLVRHLLRAAEAAGIPYQFRSPQHAGGTDAGSIHQALTGIPSVTVANPCRYLHSPHLVMRISDWEHQARLLDAAWRDLTPAVLQR